MPHFLRAFQVCLLLALLGGCASGPAIPPGGSAEISVPRAQFYKYGPAQSFGADDSLSQGTRVTMLQRDMGFSRVQLANGTAGYVANEELKPIAEGPSKPLASHKSDRAYSGPIKRSYVAPTHDEGLFDVNDVPLPMADGETSKSAPAGH